MAILEVVPPGETVEKMALVGEWVPEEVRRAVPLALNKRPDSALTSTVRGQGSVEMREKQITDN
jgi:hypothetical protein